MVKNPLLVGQQCLNLFPENFAVWCMLSCVGATGAGHTRDEKGERMKVENKLNPSEAQLQGFSEPLADGPISMVNLLKFRDRAEYPDGRETELSGAEAYGLYGAEVARIVNSLGGAIIFSAQVSRLMLGEVEELWDQVAIAQYPSRQAMLDMIMSEEYQAIAVHREAGLAGQLNIETTNAAGQWMKAD